MVIRIRILKNRQHNGQKGKEQKDKQRSTKLSFLLTYKRVFFPNFKELVAYGAGSMVCSIFSGYINAGSLSRTMVLDGTNGKSQVSIFIFCLMCRDTFL